MDAEILVEVRRGDLVEAVHRGHLAVVDGDGNLVCRLGDPNVATYTRSAAKPFQAIPFLLSGAAERFGFIEQEVALACASHNGEPIHTETAARMLSKAGFEEKDLRCGAHTPFHDETARAMLREGENPTQLHNNCSGKHASMLAFTRQIGAPADNYHKLENPIQQRILEAIEQFSGVSREEILIGIDGCSLPNFALPLAAIARMSARLVSPPADFDTETRVACRRVVAAMMTHPQIISGTGDDTLDTFVMESAAGRIVSKVGAEGVYTASVLPNPQWKRGLGIALKIENGEDRRSRPIAALEILRQLGVFDAETAESLNSVIRPPLKNRRQIIVGEVAPVFELKIES